MLVRLTIMACFITISKKSANQNVVRLKEAHRKKVLDNVLKDVAFYSAFDMGQFKNSAQYRHLEKKRKKLEK